MHIQTLTIYPLNLNLALSVFIFLPTEQTLRNSIYFSKISHSYNAVQVVHNVSCEIKRGQIVAIVGESGSGKSTMLRLLLKLSMPTTGSIFVDGTNIADYSVRSNFCIEPNLILNARLNHDFIACYFHSERRIRVIIQHCLPRTGPFCHVHHGKHQRHE